jgi:hypothetical protein
MNTMRWFLLLSCTLCGWASTNIVSIDPTQMQARITVQTDQSGTCTYRSSRGDHFTSNIADLVDNGNTDVRTGSIVAGQTHLFVLGTRKGSDALAAGATYWVGVTCGADAEVSRTFATTAIPWGNMAPDPVPFNPAKFGNMDYPIIDWTDQSKSYVDPVEGVEFWRLTSPAMLGAGAFVAQFNQTAGTPIDLAGRGNWVNPSSAVSNGTTFANAKGDSTDKLFVPFASNVFFGGASGWVARTNVDDILVNVFCGNASPGGIAISLQLTFDGGQTVVGAPVSVACPTSGPVKIGAYPQAKPLPLFRGWGISPPQHNLVIPPSGTVSVSSSIATVQSPGGSNNYFVTDWVPGTPILINSNYYHVASVQSPTQLTLTEDPGTLTNVPYAGANSGIVVIKNGTGNVDVSLGLDLYGSSIADNGVNGDVPMVNSVPVSVSKTADGLTTLNPPLSGYLSTIGDTGGGGAILLWIPYNSDGSPRNEMRLLSVGVKLATSPSFHAAGDSFSFNVAAYPRTGTAFDGVDGKSWIGQATDNIHLFRMTYDETLPGCAGYPAYSPYPASGAYNNSTVNITDDCFQWTNLMPSSSNPPMDVVSQMKRGYQTGLNSLGEAVGPAHPNFDLGWFNPPVMSLTEGGYFTFVLVNGNEHLGIYAAFDGVTGVLKSIRNTWGGDSDTETRWGGLHGVSLTGGTWRFAGMNTLDDTSGAPTQKPFLNAFDLPVLKVNRAGFGAPTQWDTNTAVTGTEAYGCPTAVPTRYASLAGTQNCIQVKVSTPPCNPTPNSTYVFPDGKTEKDEFPCTTPGFGVADPNRSKLMDMKPGDWLKERRTGPYNEQYVALSVTYNGTNDIDIWLLRWARHNYLLPLMNNGDDYSPTVDSRANGWFLSMAPSFNTGASSMAIDVSAGASAKWLPDNGARATCHGVIGPGTAPGLFTYAEPCDPPSYRGNYNVPIQNMLFQPFLQMGAGYPSFAGSANGVTSGFAQNYTNNSWYFGAVTPPFQLDLRHLNPPFGAGPEYLAATMGDPRTLNLVSGTSKTYLISDTISAGQSDYKRLPLYGFAGHYLLKDISGPATGNTADLPDYSVCRAFKSGECFASSAVGNVYVSVPKAFVDSFCRTNQFTLPDPCAFQLSPYVGQLTQVRTDRQDTVGLTARKLGYVHGMPGLQYQFSNCRATPDGNFAFCVADWLDGVRSEWVALRLSPMPKIDSLNRTSFVPVTLNYQGSPGASNIRARFGYAENGGSLLRCTAYQVECTTEIPVAAPSEPYGFTNESVTRQNCAINGACTITIPAISNRMLYYVVDRLDNSGNVVASFPMQVVAVP